MPIPMPNGKQSYYTSAGVPLVGGRLYTYAAGTSTPKATWSDAAGTTPNANPIVLDARGEAVVFFAGAYKLELRDAANAVLWTVDNIIATDTTITTADGRTTLPSATTVDLGTTTVRAVDISGTTTIQSFGTTAADGAFRIVRFTGAMQLSHNATSLILPGGANILTAAGDTAIAVCLGSGNWYIAAYQRATQAANSGNLLINPNFAINQRSYVSGTATTGANQYTLDRWRVVVSGQSVSWTESSGVRTITAPAGGIEQVIEDVDVIGAVGKSYVLSWSGTASATVNGNAVTSGRPISNITGGATVTVRFSGGTVNSPQFEAGVFATQFQSRPRAQELTLCQRYYRPVIFGVQMPVTSGQVYGGSVTWPEMRIAPTYSFVSCNTAVQFPATAPSTNVWLHSGMYWSQTASGTGAGSLSILGYLSAEL